MVTASGTRLVQFANQSRRLGRRRHSGGFLDRPSDFEVDPSNPLPEDVQRCIYRFEQLIELRTPGGGSVFSPQLRAAFAGNQATPACRSRYDRAQDSTS